MQAEFVAKSINDDYGLMEAKIIRFFLSLVSSNNPDLTIFIKKVNSLKIEAEKLNVPNSLDFWMKYLAGESQAKEYCQRGEYFDYEFEKRTLEFLIKGKEKAEITTCDT